jgi:hypothetical protein
MIVAGNRSRSLELGFSLFEGPVMTKLEIEELVRAEFNREFNAQVGKYYSPYHEFDLFEEGSFIGGITTSPWRNRTGTNNTGGQDRVAAELLWLTRWPGPERCCIVLTDLEMAQRIHARWNHGIRSKQVDIYHFEADSRQFTLVGIIKDEAT